MKKIVSFQILILLLSLKITAQNIGINTDGSTPDAGVMLDIKPSSSGSVDPLLLRMRGTTDGAQYIAVLFGNNNFQYYHTLKSRHSSTANNSNALDFYLSTTTSGTQKQVLSLTGAGNVGIGTIAPSASAMLEMSSTSGGLLIPRMTAAQKVAIGTPATGLLIYQTDAPVGFWYYNGTSWLPLLGAISSSDGTAGWSLTGNTGTTAGTNYLGTSDAKDFVIKTNGTERVRVKSGGNVGIGTNAPAQKLEITGNTRISGGNGLEITETGNPFLRIALDQSTAGYSCIVNNWGNSSNPGVVVGSTRTDGNAFQVGTGITLDANSLPNSNGTQRFLVQGNGDIGMTATDLSHSLQGGTVPYKITRLVRIATDNDNEDALFQITSSGGSSHINLFSGNSTDNPAFIWQQNKSIRFGVWDSWKTATFTSMILINGTNGYVGINNDVPSARLSIANTGVTELTGTSHSSTFRTIAGTLGNTVGDLLQLASIGYKTNQPNSCALGFWSYRHSTTSPFPHGWDGTSIGLTMDVDNSARAGNGLWLKHNGYIGIGTPNPQNKFEVSKDGTTEGFSVSTGGVVKINNVYSLPTAVGISGQALISAGATSNWGTLGVAGGGTGANSLTGMIKGNGIGAFTGITGTQWGITYWSNANTIASTAAGTAGQVLISNGAAAPAWANMNSYNWSLTGNSGTTPGTNYLGTSDAKDLILSTAATERFRITSDGTKFGFNTGGTPTYNFHVKPASGNTIDAMFTPTEWNSTDDYSKIMLGFTDHYIKAAQNAGMDIYTNDDLRFYTGTGSGGSNVGKQRMKIEETANNTTYVDLTTDPSDATAWNSSGDFVRLRLGDDNHYIHGEYGVGMTFNDVNKFNFTGGNVGINQTAPEWKLQMTSSGNNTPDALQATNANKSRFLTVFSGSENANDDSPALVWGQRGGTAGLQGNILRLGTWNASSGSSWQEHYRFYGDGNTTANATRVDIKQGYDRTTATDNYYTLDLRKGDNTDVTGTCVINDNLNVYGTIWANGATITNGFTTWSDGRFKTNIYPINFPSEKIKKLNGVYYLWRTDTSTAGINFPVGKQMGLIAQDVEKVFPEAVIEFKGLKTIDYGKLISPLIEAFKEQQILLEQLIHDNQLLESDNKNLKEYLDKLDTRLKNIEALSKTDK